MRDHKANLDSLVCQEILVTRALLVRQGLRAARDWPVCRGILVTRDLRALQALQALRVRMALRQSRLKLL